ncbi:hypothetical protein K7432_010504 [Basidiobolus ranarum]|uniref:Arrestin C-terminal-like domain-containing protein n=1 Tax=Basidiobolus ranarum TaxID=34480 RepID=A0ABR2WNL8_9FUNG
MRLRISKSLFQIQMAEEIFYHNLHNWRDDLTIKGNLVLFPTSKVSISHITLKFVGRILLTEEYQKFEKILIEKSWDFISQEGSSCTFGPQPHSFGFLFEFPGDLPESLETSDCKIEYLFYATAKTSLFRSNLKTSKKITICNFIGPILGVDCGTRRQGIYKDLIAYEVGIPALDFCRGDSFHVNFKFQLLQQHIQPRFIACGIRELVTYRMPLEETYTHKASEESWVVATVEPCKADETEQTLLVQVPISASKVQYSHQSDFVEISHFLYGQIQFPNVNVQISFPVLIARQKVLSRELPPFYEDSRSLPPSYQQTPTDSIKSRASRHLIRKPVITVVSKATKHSQRMSIPNHISTLIN